MWMLELPGGPGAYALWIELSAVVSVPIRRLGTPRLQPGCYVYCGSARGAGGIRARVARHLRRHKKTHWHVDHLTEAGIITAILSAPGCDECTLVAQLMATAGASVPVPGLGSTDCARCTAHLVAVPRTLDPVSVGFQSWSVNRGAAGLINSTHWTSGYPQP